MSTENYLYKGIVVTTYGVIDSPIAGNKNRVTFNVDSPGNEDNVTATFIHQIKVVDEDQYEATKLTVEGVREQIKKDLLEANKKKVLFYVHGFATKPIGYLKNIDSIAFQKNIFMLIPVLWPSEGNLGAEDPQLLLGGRHPYQKDQAFSEAAGKLLQSLAPTDQTESISKSILCHSMGNRVLRFFANEGVTFDNIFMVAADVDAALFDASTGWRWWPWSNNKENIKQALDIMKMLTKGKGGKIHVLYNEEDEALKGSVVLNSFQVRLGSKDVDLEKVIPEVKGFIQSKNLKDVPNPGNHDAGEANHNYQFKPHVLAYYETCESQLSV